MIIEFEYNYEMEFYLRTYSALSIKGNGVWDVDEDELIKEWNSNEYSAKDFINNYFWTELDIDPVAITFNEDDINKLANYILENENRNNESNILD